MAFPWSLLDSSSLASGHIVEDMQLGLDLALRGYPAMFCPDVRVTSRFPEGKATIKGQRTRWEHGHLGVIIATVPRLLAESLRRRDVPLFALALDLMVPPLALLLILVTLSVCVGLLFVLAGGGALPLLLSLLLEGLLVFSVLLAWHRFGRHSIALLDLTYAPLYALRKIPIYLKFWTGKQREWVRSRRDGD
jgi:cellulose synthase/poly-beta-1,6-N-acetylglucosamine synthase-like glycosyltransferase